MQKVDRNNEKHAKEIIEKLLPNLSLRNSLIEFISSAIIFANEINSKNWNLNLDKNGRFIRFNVGQEYCIQIKKKELLILCDKITIKPILKSNKLPIVFRGHIKNKKIHSTDIDKVPNCVSKTKNNVGCVLELSESAKYLDLIKKSNFDFINNALYTKILPQMRDAHSKGLIKYFSRTLKKEIPDPLYVLSNLPSFDEIINKQEKEIKNAQKISSHKRKEILKKSIKKPTKTNVNQSVFNRNPHVVAEVLYRAKGVCEYCKQIAPFYRDADNSPYLEVHHIIPLSEGGDDTVVNSMALCPNCHRMAHYGKKTFNK